MRSALHTSESILQWLTSLARTISMKNFEDLKIDHNKPILHKLYLDVIDDLKPETITTRQIKKIDKNNVISTKIIQQG